MNIRRLSYGLLLTFATTAVVACGGDQTQAETPAVTASAVAEPAPAPAVTADAVATAAPTPAPTVDATPPPPAPKPAKDKFVGKWAQDFSGAVHDAADADATKKAGPKKDQKKYDAAMKKASDAIANTFFENTADGLHTFTLKGKVVHAIHFDVSKDDSATLTIKLNKDDKTKKDLKGAEVTFTFVDDNTINVSDPWAKDPTKALVLVFKRQ
jgi:hypothetical protein